MEGRLPWATNKNFDHGNKIVFLNAYVLFSWLENCCIGENGIGISTEGFTERRFMSEDDDEHVLLRRDTPN
jgi:hypothetical protein